MYMDIIVTNNPLTEAMYRNAYRVECFETPGDVLTRVRDLVHGGRLLLTHPLPGGVKPNETPYRSVLVSETSGAVDEQSLRIIEECIRIVRDFPPATIPDRFLRDLQTVDLSLIQSALSANRAPPGS